MRIVSNLYSLCVFVFKQTFKYVEIKLLCESVGLSIKRANGWPLQYLNTPTNKCQVIVAKGVSPSIPVSHHF